MNSLPPRHPESFVADLTRHQGRIRGFIRCLLLHPAAVEDVLQETNMLLWLKAGEFTPGTDFWAWAATVARFQVLTHLKKSRRDRHVFDPALITEIAGLAEEQAGATEDRRAALASCVDLLPAPQRQLLDRRYGQGQSVDAIARGVDRPAGSVRQSLYRIREALLGCIERRLAAEGAP